MIMGKDYCKYSENFFKLKNNGLVLELSTDSNDYNTRVKHISGVVLASGFIEKEEVDEWLDKNIDKLISRSRELYNFDTNAILEMCNGVKIVIDPVRTGNECRGNSPIPNQEMPHPESVFTLSTITPYSELQILDFLKLSGLDFQEARLKLKEYSRIGAEITTINNLLKLGHLSYER